MGTLRMLLALAVAMGHGGGIAGYYIVNGVIAVQCFYVISGFLITHILLTKYDETPRGTWLFYTNRAARIFIPYWIVLVATIALCLMTYAAFGQSGLIYKWIDEAHTLDFSSKVFFIFTNLFLFGQDVSLWLVQNGGGLSFDLNAITSPDAVFRYNVVTQAWTLAVELTFYTIAPFIVRRSVVVIAAILAVSLAARFWSYHLGFYSSGTGYRFFPFELALFLMGSLGYRLYQFVNGRKLLVFRNSAILTAIIVGVTLTTQFNPYFETWTYYVVVAILLPSLFNFTLVKPDAAMKYKIDAELGKLSYPIYLIHLPVLSVMHSTFGPQKWIAPVMIVLTIGLSVALVRFVEAPLDRWRQKRLKRNDSSGTLTPDKQQSEASRIRSRTGYSWRLLRWRSIQEGIPD